MNDTARFSSQKAILEKYVKLFPDELVWQECLELVKTWEYSRELVSEMIKQGRANELDKFIEESFEEYDDVYKALADK